MKDKWYGVEWVNVQDNTTNCDVMRARSKREARAKWGLTAPRGAVFIGVRRVGRVF